MTNWVGLSGVREFDAWIRGARIQSNGDVSVTLHPEGAIGDLLRNRAGVENPKGLIEGWIDVRSAHRDVFVKYANGLSGRRPVRVIGQHVERNGVAAIQPMDCLYSQLRPQEYKRSALELIASLEAEADNVAYDADGWFRVTRILAAADASDMTHPPLSEGPRKVSFRLKWTAKPVDEGSTTWVPQWKALAGPAENVGLGVITDSSDALHPVAEVSFVLLREPTESVLMKDLALYWAPKRV